MLVSMLWPVYIPLVVSWAVSLAFGTVVAVVVGAVSWPHLEGRWRPLLGAGCAGILAGLAAAELVDAEVGDWWAGRPMLAASVSGLLLLAVTALVIEAILHRAAQLRWRGALRTPIERIRQPVTKFARWTSVRPLRPYEVSPDVRGRPLLSRLLLDRDGLGADDARWWRTIPQTMDQATADAAPLLLATDFRELFESASELQTALQGLAATVDGFDRAKGVRTEDKHLMWEKVERFDVQWRAFVDALLAFDDRCHDDLSLERCIDSNLARFLKRAHEPSADAPTENPPRT